MMNSFSSLETNDPKWQSLSSSQNFFAFLDKIALTNVGRLSTIRQIAVGVIVWTDGWDTSTGCKSNRSPMHTGTITLLIVDVESGQVVGIVTYPNMGGPGKIDHGTVFRRFQEDIAAYERNGNDRIFCCRHYGCEVEVHTHIMFVVQDQPERRQASGLLGGGSRLHPLFGMSCDFLDLQLPFQACKQCDNHLDKYVAAKDWTTSPMTGSCQHCLGWSLERLTTSSYKSSVEYPPYLEADTPGASLFDGPGYLPSRLLIVGWNHCINMFAVQNCWLEADVKKYLQQLCINDATIASFIQKCRRHVYLQEVKCNAGEYTHEQIASTIKDSLESPKSYDLPLPPAMWLLADTDANTEGIMHLSMGIQKAVFKFIIRWATDNRNGSTLQRRLAVNLAAVQDLKVAYCPCRPYKDDKFGGFTAEGYRAM